MNPRARSKPVYRLVWESARKHVATYAFAVGIPLLVIAFLCYLGSLFFGAEAAFQKTATADAKPLLNVLIALTAILVVSRIGGGLFARLGQPRVLGEIVAGILLGPSLFGAFAPDASQALVPPQIRPILEVVGQLGLILFMFQVGLEFDFNLLRRKGHVAVLVSHTSICLPMLGGICLGLLLYPLCYRGGVPFLPFTLFMGLAMSVTAFPVLTRILRDRNLISTPLGALALACAAADDITAWCLLAALLAFGQSEASAALVTIAQTALFCMLLWGVVRPLAKRMANSPAWASLGTVLLGLLCAALAAERIGIHAFFGAFAFGLCIPRGASAAGRLKPKLEELTCGLLMPAFFVTSGMRTELGLLDWPSGWLICGLVIAVATAGKLIGVIAPARAAGLGWHDSLQLGVLMNTRGLMEIVIANVGLECGIIPPQMFTVLVITAVVTTLATGPLLQVLERYSAAQRS
jgi:Kef-type K+ transport system membrane component KefB